MVMIDDVKKKYKNKKDVKKNSTRSSLLGGDNHLLF
jgi:hypothetical protein